MVATEWTADRNSPHLRFGICREVMLVKSTRTFLSPFNVVPKAVKLNLSPTDQGRPSPEASAQDNCLGV